jgi:hypothetical protein
MAQPDNAYQPSFVGGAAAVGGRLQWSTRENGAQVIYKTEPSPSLWKRLMTRILAWLPVRNEL